MPAQTWGAVGVIQVQDSGTNGQYMVNPHIPGDMKPALALYPTQYKMRGWNPLTSTWEHWTTNNSVAGPPSGANLTGIVIAMTLKSNYPTTL